MGGRGIDKELVARAQNILKELEERKAQKAAEEKARWENYYEQLEKATPFQGGAKKTKLAKPKIMRFW